MSFVPIHIYTDTNNKLRKLKEKITKVDILGCY